MDQERLDEIRARYEATTPGPWTMADEAECRHNTYSTVPRDANGNHVCQSFTTRTDAARVNNGVFIAHARQDVPDLLDEVERLRAALCLAERAAMRGTSRRIVGGSSPEHGRFVIWECGHCAREFRVYVSGRKERAGKHEDDCPFAMLERR